MWSRWSTITSSFWSLQIAGWASYGVLWYLASLPVYQPLGVPAWIPVVRVLYYVAVGAAVTMLLRPLYRRLWARNTPVNTLLPTAVGASLAGTLIWLVLFEGMKWPLDAPAFQDASLGYFARPFVNNSFVLLAWSALYFGFKYQQDLQAQQQRTLRAETLSREAQLKMLRYQLNPHFLFNTLNTLRVLVDNEDERAAEIVTELSEFLRYTLLDTDEPLVPLQEEIDVTRAYLAIEKIRYEDRLIVTYRIDPDAESAAVPPFLIHSLVENAVKHGMATSTLPLRIRLEAHCRNDTLHLAVANTGHLTPSREPLPTSHGIGLENVRQRLKQLYPERHSFDLYESDGWVHAAVTVKPTGADVSHVAA